MFKVHVGILNHWEGFLSRISNQLPEKTKLCIMLKCICQVVPSSFDARCLGVEPNISLTHSASSSWLIIMHSGSFSFQIWRPLDHGRDLIIHFHNPTALYNTWCTLAHSKHLGNKWVNINILMHVLLLLFFKGRLQF